MIGVANHSRAWHDAKQGITDAERDHANAVSRHGADSWQARDAAGMVKDAKSGFDRIDRDNALAYDW